MTCANCGATLLPEARFCMHCGRPTTPADGERHARIAGAAPTELANKMRTAHVSAERKLVTAVFADVVGSTSIAETMDPEEWVGILNRAFDLLSDAVYRYEGTVALLVGDGLLAFFGAPVAHEDDPERAVRTALAMQDAIAELAAKLKAHRGIDFRIRVGINTGEVVVGRVGSDLRYEYTAIGDTMNVAARMQDAAEPGTVLVTAATHRFIGSRFYTEDRGVKGRSRPVHAFRVIAPASSPSSTRGLAGHRSSLVGRDDEMAQLEQALSDTRGESIGRFLIVMGEAGIGKSRLLAEFRGRTSSRSQGRWAEGQCLSYGHRLPYHLAIDLVRSMIGISAGADEEQVRATLRDRLRDLGGDDEDVPYLEHLLLLPQDPDVARRFDGLEPSGLLVDYVAALERRPGHPRPAGSATSSVRRCRRRNEGRPTGGPRPCRLALVRVRAQPDPSHQRCGQGHGLA